jgi:hypothetical protein
LTLEDGTYRLSRNVGNDKYIHMLRFEVSRSVLTDLDTSKNTQKAFSCCYAIGNWPRGPAVSMRSELLVAHEKLGQLPLLMVHVVPV